MPKKVYEGFQSLYIQRMHAFPYVKFLFNFSRVMLCSMPSTLYTHYFTSSETDTTNKFPFLEYMAAA